MFVRIGRHAKDFHLAGARADQRQNVIFKTPDRCPNAFGEKVVRQKRLLMTTEELGPGAVVPTGRIGTESVFAQDIADSPSFDVLVAESVKLAEDAPRNRRPRGSLHF